MYLQKYLLSVSSVDHQGALTHHYTSLQATNFHLPTNNQTNRDVDPPVSLKVFCVPEEDVRVGVQHGNSKCSEQLTVPIAYSKTTIICRSKLLIQTFAQQTCGQSVLHYIFMRPDVLL